MTEDNRIPEIRAVLDELPGIEPHERDAAWRIADSRSKALQRIRAILDAPRPPREPWQVQAHIRRQRAEALGYCEQVIEEAPDGDDDTCGELRKHGSAYCEEHQPPEKRAIPEPPLSGVALRDVEERDAAAGDLP